MAPVKQDLKESRVSFVEGPSTSQKEDSIPYKDPYSMTEELLRKKYDQTDSGRFISQFCVAIVGNISKRIDSIDFTVSMFTASLSAFSFGSLLGWSRIDNLFSLVIWNCYEESWATSLMPLGCSLAFTPSFYIIRNMGPKKTMTFITPFYILSFLFLTKTSIHMSFMATRFITGFLGTIYLVSSESLLIGAVHRKNLTYMLAITRTCLSIGLLVSYTCGHFLGTYSLTILCCIIPFVNTLFSIILPESPAFLYQTNRQKAFEAVQWYHGHQNMYTALHYLESDTEKHKSGGEVIKYMLFSKSVAKGIALVTITNFFKVFSGYFVFILYDIIRHHPKLTVFNNFIDTMIFMIVMIVVNCCVYCTRNFINFGVRKPLILSSTVVTLALLAETTYLYMVYINYFNENFSEKYGIQLIITCSLVVGYGCGFETCPDELLHAYLPYQIHTIAKSLTRTTYWFFIFCLMQFVLLSSSCNKHHIPFAHLSIISCMGIVYCYVFIIECKDKSLMHIQVEIGGNPVGSRGAFRGRLNAPALQNAL